jgi:hypothetical protein
LFEIKRKHRLRWEVVVVFFTSCTLAGIDLTTHSLRSPLMETLPIDHASRGHFKRVFESTGKINVPLMLAPRYFLPRLKVSASPPLKTALRAGVEDVAMTQSPTWVYTMGMETQS